MATILVKVNSKDNLLNTRQSVFNALGINESFSIKGKRIPKRKMESEAKKMSNLSSIQLSRQVSVISQLESKIDKDKDVQYVKINMN